MKRIAIFASGKGSNAENIIKTFKRDKVDIKVSVIVTNNPQSNVINIAKKQNIPHFVIDKDFQIVRMLEVLRIDMIVLAGFLWKVPEKVWSKFPTINIHPSLLPKFGGKGMYGDNVFNAVINSTEFKSGITIHWVNGNYDEGNIILQEDFYVYQSETLDTLRKRTQTLEYKNYPKVIKELLLQN